MSLSRIIQWKTRSALLLSGARTLRFSPASAPALCLLTLLWLAGCASTSPAPVDTREQVQKQGRRGAQKGATMHRVEKGDTLYSIAWRYDLDYHRLAGWNRIDSSYRIYPGQVLRLSASSQPAVTTVIKAPATTRVASKPKPTATESPGRTPPPPVRKAPVVATKPPGPVAKPPAQVSKPAAQVSKPLAGAPKPTSTAASNGVLKWVWPTRGTVVQAFLQGDRTRQGIRIAGKAGQPVIAAESGKVVYTGSGLPGYGKLIIVKHNKNYLSAYGFNRKLLVNDGDQVTRGERIAEMGQSTDGKSLLHFEIRRRDRPLDPLKRLPR